MKKQRKQGELVIKDRNFKMGEVFRWVPSHASQEEVEAGAANELVTRGYVP